MPEAVPTAPGTPEETSRARTAARHTGEWLGKLLLSPFAELGTLSRLFGATLFWGVRPPYRGRLFVEAMEFIGIGSIFIVSLTALFVVAVHKIINLPARRCLDSAKHLHWHASHSGSSIAQNFGSADSTLEATAFN